MATTSEGLMASTQQNRLAGRILRDLRRAAGLRQSDFAIALSERLGVSVQQSKVSSWESGVRTMPAAALLAAQTISGTSLDHLLSEDQDVSSTSIYRDATRQLADAVEQLARMAANPSSRSGVTAETVLARARNVRRILDGTDTPTD